MDVGRLMITLLAQMSHEAPKGPLRFQFAALMF